MRLYPAIDIIGGQCVRLVQGDYSQKTTFAENPVEVALRWQEEGGEFLHIVDLDGAKSGGMNNFETISRIADTLSIPIEVGGGIRDMHAVEKMLQAGAARVILGTSALRDAEFVKNAVKAFGEKIVVGIDAKDGKVAVSGWEEVSSKSALDFAKEMEQCGVQTLIYTDIATDGMLKGPNLTAMREMAAHVAVDVVASGGVSSVADLQALKETGVEGAIIGKALYTGAVRLKDAIEKIRGKEKDI